MKSRASARRQALAGAVLIASLGVVALMLPPLQGLALLGYDLPTKVRGDRPVDDVQIVYLDGTTYEHFKQSPDNFDRRHHARLLDKLTADGARLVVFDVVFDHVRDDAQDGALEKAIQSNKRVILAAVREVTAEKAFQGTVQHRPLERFESVAAGVGLAQLIGQQTIVRQYVPGDADLPSLPLAAWKATHAGLPLPHPAGKPPWIRYYGRPGTIAGMSFRAALEQEPGFFADKFIFIGAHPRTPDAFDEVEEFRVPHSLMGGSLSTGVEIWATAFLNLHREESLSRWPWWLELGVAGLIGLVAGWFLSQCRPGRAAVVTGLGMVILMVSGFCVFHVTHAWFAWPVPVLVQLPGALAFSTLAQFSRLRQETEQLRESLVAERAQRPTPVSELLLNQGQQSNQPSTTIADHELLCPVGRGAFGEVWLARNAVGLFHAMKLIFRRDFERGDPYEREFRGIQKFMPISRSHPGLVDVLHVGRNDKEGYFHYIMETADDVSHGRDIEPSSYQPKSLTTELKNHGYLSAKDAIKLVISLAEALEFLHGKGLIHRDIKPANIIYVDDKPKLADIGLVTEMAGTHHTVSRIGTEGYMPPEGPGTPSADVFSLGKVLYETCYGMNPLLFPEYPDDLDHRPDRDLLRKLDPVIGKACDSDPEFRYPTAAAFREALMRVSP